MKIILVVWALAALAVSFAPFPPIAIPIGLVALVATGVALRRSLPIDDVPLRTLVIIHVVRAFIGAAFLVLYQRGVLPAEFAIRGGLGDILVGALAVPVAFSSSRKVLLFAWNVFGLLDLVMVVVTANKLAFIDHDPLQRAVMASFPFPLLPFFVVPAMVLSHLAIFGRSLKAPTPASHRA